LVGLSAGFSSMVALAVADVRFMSGILAPVVVFVAPTFRWAFARTQIARLKAGLQLNSGDFKLFLTS
jgi:hypothetical protein